MNTARLIQDLEKKLDFYESPNWGGPDVITPLHSNIAELLAAGNVYPRVLNRATVLGLLQGQATWLHDEEGWQALKDPVPLAELEQQRVVTFKSGLLEVVRPVPVADDMPQKLKQQLATVASLYDIKHGGDGWVAPHVRVDECYVTELGYLQACHKLSASYGGYEVSFEDEDLVGVGTLLWEQLRASRVNPEVAFEEWWLKMVLAYRQPYVFHLKFRSAQAREDFLACAFQYVMADDSLQDTWEQCAADIALSPNRMNAIVRTARRDSDEVLIGSVASEQEAYCPALDLSQLDEVIERYRHLPNERIFDCFQWWRETSDYYEYGTTHHLVAGIVKYECEEGAGRDSSPYTRLLLQHSTQAPHLAEILFRKIHSSHYACLLLRDRATSHIGLIQIHEWLHRAAQRLSHRYDYDMAWQQLVFAQALEVYAIAHDETIDAEAARDTVLAIAEVFAWMAERETASHAESKGLLPGFKQAVERMEYRGPEDGRASRLFKDHCHLAADFLVSRRKRLWDRNDELPVAEWMFSFWCIQALSEGDTGSDARKRAEVATLLANDYLRHLKQRFGSARVSIDDGPVFDSFDWSGLLRCCNERLRRTVIHAFDGLLAHDAGATEEAHRGLFGAVRTHLRFLLRLVVDADPQCRKDVFDALLCLIQDFGFAADRLAGVFEVFNDSVGHSKVQLWSRVCQASNLFPEDDFTKFLGVLQDRPTPLGGWLELYEATRSSARKSRILEQVATLDFESERIVWIPEISRVAVMAANAGQLKLAQRLVKYGASCKRSHSSVSFEPLDQLIELKAIADDATLNDKERIARLDAFLDDATQASDEVSRYARQLMATCYLSIDAQRAFNLFDALLKVQRQISCATGRLKASRALAEKEGASKVGSESWQRYVQWREVYRAVESQDVGALDFEEALGLLLECKQWQEFDCIWRDVPERFLLSCELVHVRCVYLQEQGQVEEALAHLHEVEKLHVELPAEQKEAFEMLAMDLRKNNASRLKRSRDVIDLYIKPDHTHARVMWQEIRALAPHDQSLVFGQAENEDALEQFIASNIHGVTQELLIRKNNLYRPTDRDERTVIDQENMINDWLTSLLGQRLDYLGWTVKDQPRVGSSASKNGVGEIDGGIYVGTHCISIVEAFRLRSFERKTIEDHLNKVAGYNSPGVTSIAIVIYSTGNFLHLCTEYARCIDRTPYSGFESQGTLTLDKERPHLKVYRETRPVKGSDVHIYHYLLDLQLGLADGSHEAPAATS
ncbi:hypothetical protein LJR277_002849 [Pseudomonas sp. LjRoot277]|uniref:hypothetical protein n=1 Tax=Pseudomonas sp. LjRoot277 TaxID=3342307 RepID=UPI003ECF04EF